jgi:hypothetical protein
VTNIFSAGVREGVVVVAGQAGIHVVKPEWPLTSYPEKGCSDMKRNMFKNLVFPP